MTAEARLLKQELAEANDYIATLNRNLTAKETLLDAQRQTIIDLSSKLTECKRAIEKAQAEYHGLYGILSRPWRAAWYILRGRSTRAEIEANREYLAAYRAAARRKAANRRGGQSAAAVGQPAFPHRRKYSPHEEQQSSQSPVRDYEAYFPSTSARGGEDYQGTSGRKLQEGQAQEQAPAAVYRPGKRETLRLNPQPHDLSHSSV